MNVWSKPYMTQTATYWGAPTIDRYGDYSYPAPVQIACRWEDNNEKVTDADGNEFVSRSVVYPEQDLARGGWLYLGTSVEADPHDQEGAYEVRQVRAIPDLRGKLVEYKIWL